MHQQQMLIERFKRYLHDKYGEVVHIQTHISHVFLADELAYKIKKPVNFGFLDFSELPQRQHFCQEEIRLNKRLAPLLYLDVQGLNANGSLTPAMGAANEPVIRMRRFDQANRLDNFARSHGLDDAMVDALAQQIERFHATAAQAPQSSHFGTPETVYFPINQNFEQIRSFLVDEADQNQLDQIEAASEAAFLTLKPLIVARKQQGFVREGHGDMHLGNIARIDGEIVIFDGIEFNEDFRWSDTASDLAFLLMDLADRQLTGAARRLLNAYLEATGDYESLPLLPFYRAYRAMVRAKIALFEIRPDSTEAEQAAQWATYRRYTALAEQFLAPRVGSLWITVGFSGSGKSLAALELVMAHGAVRVRSDAERLRLYTDRAQRYSADASAHIYAHLAHIARIGVNSGWPMVIDATFLRLAQRRGFADLAARMGCPFHILFIECDGPTLRRYLRERNAAGRDISEADEQVLETQMQQLEPLSVPERACTFRLRCDAPFGGQMQGILQAL